MNDCRAIHTSSVLKNGKVLIAGGVVDDPEHGKNVKYIVNGAELFDPTTGGWTRTASLNQGRTTHTASVLLDGKVLVVGGGAGSALLDSAELYDPSTGNWSIVESMIWKRAFHTATTLGNGKVLVTGGLGGENGILNTTEMYDPLTRKWKSMNSMSYRRYAHSATLLKNGKVLVIGGQDDDGYSLGSTELFDPSTETWTVSGTMNSRRSKHTASLLINGKVLVAGGGLGGDVFPGLMPINTSEIYDPLTEIWTNTNSMHYTRTWHTASVLENGNVLVVGGTDDNIGSYTAELYNASANTYVHIHDFRNV